MDWLFDTPWWLPTVLWFAGVVLFVSGNRRIDKKLQRTGLALLLVGILIALISYLVDTPKEKAIAGTRKLVESFEKKDWEGFSSVLPARVNLALLNSSGSVYSSKDELVAGAKDAQEKYIFHSAHITSVSAEQAGSLITVSLDVITTSERPIELPITSSWQFEWQERPDGWKLEHIIAVKIAN